jgi:hypothetical protein
LKRRTHGPGEKPMHARTARWWVETDAWMFFMEGALLSGITYAVSCAPLVSDHSYGQWLVRKRSVRLIDIKRLSWAKSDTDKPYLGRSARLKAHLALFTARWHAMR